MTLTCVHFTVGQRTEAVRPPPHPGTLFTGEWHPDSEPQGQLRRPQRPALDRKPGGALSSGRGSRWTAPFSI